MDGATPPAIVAARRLAARIRVALAALGTVLLGVEPTLHPRPLAAAIGLAILAVTGLVHGSGVGERWLRLEEALACSAGVLIVTLGGGSISALTLIWLGSAAVGVVARGGGVGTAGRVLVVGVLLSPMLRVGVTVDSVSLLATGCGLLLAVGRMSMQTAELLPDPLTNTLANAAFDAQFERLAAHADPHRTVGVVVIDLDDKGQTTAYIGPRLTGLAAEGAGGALERLCLGEGIDIALQPIVDLVRGTPHAYEALARFDQGGGFKRSDRERNLVREADGPLAWFTLADRFGCRRDLERTCARAALTRLGDVPDGAGLTVNLSPDMLDDELLLELVERTDGAERLVLEITERQAVAAEAQVAAALARWRACGVTFAVDDVGAGHAGLGQLALVRPEYLKLDRTVVQGMRESPDRATFVRSLTEYVQSSHTRVVAEGIETDADLTAVRDAGIELVQGFLLGRPTMTLDVRVPV